MIWQDYLAKCSQASMSTSQAQAHLIHKIRWAARKVQWMARRWRVGTRAWYAWRRSHMPGFERLRCLRCLTALVYNTPHVVLCPQIKLWASHYFPQHLWWSCSMLTFVFAASCPTPNPLFANARLQLHWCTSFIVDSVLVWISTSVLPCFSFHHLLITLKSIYKSI